MRPPPRLAAPAFAAVALAVLCGHIAWGAMPPAPVPTLAAPSARVLDEGGHLLRAFTTEAGRWRLPVPLHEVDPRYLALLIAYEDKRFRGHAGVDPRALARAAGQALRAGRIVSGGSTLTMQTVRLLSGERRRTLSRKWGEMVAALRLERTLSKDAILEYYVNIAPFGGNLEGVRAASLAYFAREPARLTLAQTALLIALPQSPEARRPDRHPRAAKAARDRVLARLLAAGAITEREAREAASSPVPTARRRLPQHAPQLARRLLSEAHTEPPLMTTVSRDLQASLQRLAKERAEATAPRVSAAILVMEAQTGRVRASVGAAHFLNDRRAGHVDMTRAPRSPGSTLKPFVTALAIDRGIVAPGTLIEDRPTDFNGYAPDNFDDEHRGRVTVAEALQQSLNVPAVTLLDAVGPTELTVRLREAGVPLRLPKGERPSLALALGGLGMSLSELASLYAALATDGRPRRPSATGDGKVKPRLVSARAARAVADILTRTRRPRHAPRHAIAYKTGTSYGHRDAFAVGFDARHVVAVWVGRPDGTPVATLTGYTDAAPLLFETFTRLGVEARAPAQPFAVGAALPPPLRAYPAPRSGGRSPLAIAFPPEGAVLSGGTRGEAVRVTARVNGKAPALWLLDGAPLSVPQRRRRADFLAPPGAHTLVVVTDAGESERVRFSVR